jgi:hypothetical protein
MLRYSSCRGVLNRRGALHPKLALRKLNLSTRSIRSLDGCPSQTPFLTASSSLSQARLPLLA